MSSVDGLPLTGQRRLLTVWRQDGLAAHLERVKSAIQVYPAAEISQQRGLTLLRFTQGAGRLRDNDAP